MVAAGGLACNVAAQNCVVLVTTGLDPAGTLDRTGIKWRLNCCSSLDLGQWCLGLGFHHTLTDRWTIVTSGFPDILSEGARALFEVDCRPCCLYCTRAVPVRARRLRTSLLACSMALNEVIQRAYADRESRTGSSSRTCTGLLYWPAFYRLIA